MATIKYWNGSAWELAIVGKQGPAGPTGPTGPAGSASLQRFRFVATGGETSLSGTDANGNTLAYTPGLEEVFINGAAQVRGQDYTATNGTSITGLTALIATDVVEILAWGVFNVANTISNTLIDAKGDILAGSAADTVSRLAVGANDTVLTADSSTATGLKWATVSAGGMTEIASGTLSGGSVVLSSIPSTYKNLQLIIKNYKPATDDTNLAIRFNGDSTANRYEYGSVVVSSNDTFERTDIQIQIGQDNTVAQGMYRIDIPDYANTTTWKILEALAVGNNPTTSTNLFYIRNWGVYNQTAAINSITLFPASGNFTSGDYILYGVK